MKPSALSVKNMPELPEVETVRRGLQQFAVGHRIIAIEVRSPKQWIGDSALVIGRMITGIERRGKLILIRLDSGTAISCHLKMTGQLLWSADLQTQVAGGHPSVVYIENLPNPHTRVIISCDQGATLYFNDLRKFGYFEVLDQTAEQDHVFLNKLGPEPLTDGFTVEYLTRSLRKAAKATIKPLLLDQSVIAGLGNIYADEALFRAGIYPTRKAGQLDSEEISALYQAINETIALAIKHGGSTERDYRTAVGEKGTYQNVAQVYHRTGQPCVNCGSPIERIKLGGRSTHFCSRCQR
jgi:formamidopyrimidine-DNA glycosylase